MNLKKYKEGDSIDTIKWKNPFIVIVSNYRGYTVATMKRGYYLQFMFIDIHDKRVFLGSSYYEEFGLKTDKDCKNFIDKVISREESLNSAESYPVNLIIKEEQNEQSRI